MATPIPNAEELITPQNIESALRWAPAMEVTAGKERFQAIRSILRDSLKETARAPSMAKKFLSESLITNVGKGGVSKMPRELRKILGDAGSAAFADELQSAYYFLTGKAPAGTNKVFTGLLASMKEGGVSEEGIRVLRKQGLKGLFAAGGPGKAIKALSESQRDPAIMRMLKWGASMAVKGRAPAASVELVSRELTQAAAKFTPSPSTWAALGKAGAKGTGMLARGARAVSGLGGVGLALDVIGGASMVKEMGEEQQRVQEMTATGEISEELGGSPTVATVGDKPVTARQFLRMLQERESEMKLARFNAATQEQDTTREVLSYLSGGQEEQQRATRRIQLGSARTARPQQQSVQKVLGDLNTFLGQAVTPPQ